MSVLLVLVMALGCSEPSEEIAPLPAMKRDQALEAARGAPVAEAPWNGPWTVKVLAPDPADPAAMALSTALGVEAGPLSAFAPPGPGTVAVIYLPAGAPIEARSERSAGGALVYALGPGEPAWRDRAVVTLGFAGAGIVDTLASAGRWGAEALSPAAAGAVAAWELASHYELPLAGVAVEADPALAAAVGPSSGPEPTDPVIVAAWKLRRGGDPAWAARQPESALRLAAASRADATTLPRLAGDPEPLVRARAADRLEDLPLLTGLLDDPSSVVRLVAADRLAALARAGSKDPALEAGLLQAAGRPDAYLRWKAAHGLGWMRGSKAALDALARLVEDPDIDVRREAARSLGRLGGPAAVPALEKALSDENSFVRQWAARALAELGEPSALPALRKAAQDPTTLVAEAALDGLQRHGEAVRGTPYDPPRPGDDALLQRLATGPDATARKDALKLLGGSEAGIRLSIAALEDPDGEVRKQAVDTLGWAEVPQPAVLQVLEDPDPDVQVTALIALRRRPLPGSAETIEKLLGHTDPEIRLRAAQALAALAGQEGPEGPAARALLPLVADPDERTRAAAIAIHPDRLAADEPALLVRRAAAARGGLACARPTWGVLSRTACPGTDPRDAMAALGLIALEDELLHLRASWTSPEDRPASHKVLRPPLLRPYGDPNRG